ncbi:MAG: sigma-54 dependent transcriptional regulator [Rhizobiaceae bacterium]|nr:sigma-54 dependent transcriptional regulator [Rhizobiaceae bacterium]MCV0406920.1 sigma-54 dependent transcriptional regulator [Rhizobiaceae bacterium]
MTETILVVDDDPVQLRLLSAAVERFGHRPLCVSGGQEALTALAGSEAISLVVLDLVMPGMDGLTTLSRMRESGRETPVIVQTAQGGIETVVKAMRAGAFDFVVKPVAPERLRKSIDDALTVGRRETETRRRRAARPAANTGFAFETASPAMRETLALARKAADSGIPVLIEGESGVGKEVLARAIQAAGPRADRPFVTVNCGAIPDTLVESILFGHEKGSFTGATEKHAGKFVEADGGTLFLDEIGDLPLHAQVKLLRAVQEGVVDPVGARASRKVDIRLISATHRDLAKRVEEGRFREDLYWRLAVFPVSLPPLRERLQDVPALAAAFAERFAAEEKPGRKLTLDPALLALLSAYDWPGNVRQLENAIFRAVVLAEGDRLTVDHFPQVRAQVEGVDWAAHAVSADETVMVTPDHPPAGQVSALDAGGDVRPLSEVEFEMICFALDRYRGRMSEVARRLGIGRSTLYRKLKEYGLDPDETRPDRLAS